MADVTRVNGDVLSGVNVNTTVGALVSLGGSQPVAMALVVKNVSGTAIDIRAEANAGESIEKIMQVIARSATPLYFQVENTTAGQISVMLEANGGGWTAASLQTAVRALGTAVGANNIDVSGTTVTDVGFKLALS
jgi:hypothetical protein